MCCIYSSNASQASNEPNNEPVSAEAKHVLAYKVAMLGDAGVGKTALTYQFTTSDYICAYDLSLGMSLDFLYTFI